MSTVKNGKTWELDLLNSMPIMTQRKIFSQLMVIKIALVFLLVCYILRSLEQHRTFFGADKNALLYPFFPTFFETPLLHAEKSSIVGNSVKLLKHYKVGPMILFDLI